MPIAFEIQQCLPCVFTNLPNLLSKLSQLIIIMQTSFWIFTLQQLLSFHYLYFHQFLRCNFFDIVNNLNSIRLLEPLKQYRKKNIIKKQTTMKSSLMFSYQARLHGYMLFNHVSISLLCTYPFLSCKNILLFYCHFQ